MARIFLPLAALFVLALLLSGCFPAGYGGTKSTLSPMAETRAFACIDVSPDVQNLVLVGYGQGGSDLYLLHLPTRRVTRLTDSPELDLATRQKSLVADGSLFHDPMNWTGGK